MAILNLTFLLATLEVIRSYINFEDNNFSLGHKNEGRHFSTYGDQYFVQQQNGHGCFRRSRDYDHGSGLSYQKHRQAETSRLWWQRVGDSGKSNTRRALMLQRTYFREYTYIGKKILKKSLRTTFENCWISISLFCRNNKIFPQRGLLYSLFYVTCAVERQIPHQWTEWIQLSLINKFTIINMLTTRKFSLDNISKTDLPKKYEKRKDSEHSITLVVSQ